MPARGRDTCVSSGRPVPNGFGRGGFGHDGSPPAGSGGTDVDPTAQRAAPAAAAHAPYRRGGADSCRGNEHVIIGGRDAVIMRARAWADALG